MHHRGNNANAGSQVLYLWPRGIMPFASIYETSKDLIFNLHVRENLKSITVNKDSISTYTYFVKNKNRWK